MRRGSDPVAMGIVLLPILLFSYFVTPAVFLLSPWRPRLVLIRSRGRPPVLDDLERSEGLQRAVRGRIEGPALKVT